MYHVRTKWIANWRHFIFKEFTEAYAKVEVLLIEKRFTFMGILPDK